MVCDTCQRQPNCLTHQLAAQDPTLHRMLERLQGCQQKLAHPRQLFWVEEYLRPVAHLMGRLSGLFRRYWQHR